jgi:fructoselysine-6-P-deglycase FrlB-like protein
VFDKSYHLHERLSNLFCPVSEKNYNVVVFQDITWKYDLRIARTPRGIADKILVLFPASRSITEKKERPRLTPPLSFP